ncbi:MAG TPA: tRNA (adenosine(37)-N6)-dimethylallyltransferase MiaA [Mariprofundaceae bacterium]|nr:tRNA (adenosine(37)-N6)-dimethylallyltransferase MiaA [Mariprofundaceae bacterium]
MTPRLQAVALMGATGTGKSNLAMTVAAVKSCSIVCCDSMQVYEGLDIGTAKPTRDERRQVPHYLVDCCELPDQYSAARWAKAAREAIAEENGQGRKPLIVGGTGLYLRALLHGFADIPAEGPGIRARFEMLQKEHGTPYLHRLLGGCDAAMAARLKENDTQRIMRALCVFESSGKPLSAWQEEGERNAPMIDCPVFVLEMERGLLRKRLAERFRKMLDAGWLDEARWLNAMGLPDTHPAMRSVGYRQLLDYLQQQMSLEEAIQQGITATRRYAKRQVTWFAHQTADAVSGDAESLMPRLLEALD